MITDIEDFFTKGCGRCERFETADCSSALWREGIVQLRAIARGLGLREEVKWGHPCYMHAGRNIALIGALRGDFRLNFFNAALMRDPEGIMERQGAQTAHPDTIRFTAAAQVAERAEAIRAYLVEAMGYAEAGILPDKTPREVEIPEELVEAMDADPELAEAFHALTPGRQRSYVLHLESSANPKTRWTRIEKMRPKVLAGKGFNER